MRSWFYTPPPLPQGTVPPRRFVLPTPPDTTGDSNLVPPNLQSTYNLHFYREEIISYRIRYPQIATLIPPSPGAADPPPLNAVLQSILQRIIHQHYTAFVPLPVQRPIVNPVLLPLPIDLALLVNPQKRLSRQLIFEYFSKRNNDHYAVLRSYQAKRNKVREELPFIPPGRIVAFQPNAFQTTYPGETYAFQARDRFVTLSFLGKSTLRVSDFIKIQLGPMAMEYRRGSAIVITADTYDPAQNPAILFNPSGGVTVSLYSPSGIPVLSQLPLGRIATGRFKTIYQTTLINEPGIYLVEALAVNAVNETLSAQQVAFRLTL